MANESWLDDLLGYKTVVAPYEGGIDMQSRARLAFSGAVTVTDDPERRETRVHIDASDGSSSTTVGLMAPVRLASLSDLPLSGLVDVDGMTANEGDRIGAFGQADAAESGIYIASEVGWTRAEDMDQDAELVGASLIPVKEGSSLRGQLFILATEEPMTIGASLLEFALVGSTDANSLRRVLLDDSVAAPAAGAVVQTVDGTSYSAELVRNANVAEDAAIAVSKLKTGTNGQILRTQGGAVTWSQLSVGDLGESVISPDVIATDQNNYSPAGWASATVVRMSADAPRAIRGLAFTPTMRVTRKTLINVSPHMLTLVHDSGGQAAGNRILTPRQPFELREGEGATLVYDSVQGAWRAVDTQVPPEIASIPSVFPHPVTFQAGLTTTGAVISDASAEWRYNTARERREVIPLEFASADVATTEVCWIRDGDSWRSVRAGNLYVPIRIASNSEIVAIYCGFTNSASEAISAGVSLRRRTPNFETGSAEISTLRAVDDTALLAQRTYQPDETSLHGLAFFSAIVDNYNHSYFLSISAIGIGSTSANLRLNWAAMFYRDFGPRNG